jgi:N-acetylmuramic acid 6-phosphate etherase
MGGGETALIHSIEKFEDQREYGVRQLLEAGFDQKDLLISASAGGESPFVLGAVEYAAQHATQKPWLIYCNPSQVLLERDANHPLSLPSLRAFSLFVGPMALTGSTRMQATTALMLAIGLPLLSQSPSDIVNQLHTFKAHIASHSQAALVPFIVKEAEVYVAKQSMLYVTKASCALTVLTDTTERSPTFNLSPFENRETQQQPSWVYLCLPEAVDSQAAWRTLLDREPRALNWQGFPLTLKEYLYGFNFSAQAKTWRQHGVQQHTLLITDSDHAFIWQLEGLKAEFPCEGLPLLLKQLWLKLLLNNHSTLLMGRLGFYEGNLMTSLKPSNYKLVDRAIRYVGYLWQQKYGQELDYHTLAEAVFAEMPTLKPEESIVHKSLARLSGLFHAT